LGAGSEIEIGNGCAAVCLRLGCEQWPVVKCNHLFEFGQVDGAAVAQHLAFDPSTILGVVRPWAAEERGLMRWRAITAKNFDQPCTHGIDARNHSRVVCGDRLFELPIGMPAAAAV